MTRPTAYQDSFASLNLPPDELWPTRNFTSLPELAYPEKINCAQELLDRTISIHSPDDILFHDSKSHWTYGQFLAVANRFAHVLVDELGVVSGNRVLLRGPNTPTMAAVWFAVLKAGGICVTTMPLLRSKELSYAIDKAEIDLALCDSRWLEELELTRGKSKRDFHVYPFLSSDSSSLESLSESKPEQFQNFPSLSTDIALIAFTSGTTGSPKATMHEHRDVLAICDCFPKHVLKPDKSDIFVGTPPFAFTFGLGAILLFPMRFGASISLVEKPGLDELMQTIERHKSTICFTSPTAYRAMLDHIDNHDISSLRKCCSAGETLPLPTFEAWKERTGISIIDGIGATEMLHIFISSPEESIRPGSTGKVVPGYEAKIVDDNGETLPPGTIGNLAVRGPTGCRYLSDERQKQYVRHGWNVTGDAYLMDDDGYFWFQSRTDDMIISGGYNISGIEVERALLSHADVKECGVVGVPDEQRGQIVKAFVVLKEEIPPSDQIAKALQDFVKAEIAPYKYPRAVEFLSELPRTETGKLQRFKLRDL